MLYTDSKRVTSSKHNYTYTVTMNVCDDNIGCNEVKNVMCYTTVVNSDLLTPNTCMLIMQPFWYGVELCSLVCIQLCLSIIT